jgi:hypothetical protein
MISLPFNFFFENMAIYFFSSSFFFFFSSCLSEVSLEHVFFSFFCFIAHVSFEGKTKERDS